MRLDELPTYEDLCRKVESIARRRLDGPKRPVLVVPDVEPVTNVNGARRGCARGAIQQPLEHRGASTQNNTSIRRRVWRDRYPHSELSHVEP